jgi:hypothetical protein
MSQDIRRLPEPEQRPEASKPIPPEAGQPLPAARPADTATAPDLMAIAYRLVC